MGLGRNPRHQTRHQRNAQSTIEYAAVIVFLTAALVAMQIYIKRGFQGRLKEAADELGEQYSAKTTTSMIAQNIITFAEIKVRPILVDIKNEITNALIGTTEVTVFERSGNQLEVLDDSYEQTGTSNEETLYE